jgi:multicomponent K+:H+ antiporter subunit D
MSGMAWLTDHLAVLPVLLPAFTAMLLLLVGDHGGDVHGGHGHHKLLWARRISQVSLLLFLALAVALVLGANAGGVDGAAETLRVYWLGDWPAPYGIVLVVDRLGAMMLLLTALVALPVMWYATGGWDSHGRYFHAMFQFQIMGLAGAFVTGDLFNLFVFFEVLLIASYVLMLHGLGAERLRAGMHYVALNLVASALFLIGVALLYAKTGTLNLADLAMRVPLLTGAEAKIAQAAGLVLLVVFGVKAALMPLGMWLPGTYSATSAPVAALFALMTKVGVYAIFRVHGVVFGSGAGESALTAAPWLLPLALITSAIGVAGALAAQTMSRLVAWLTVASVGTVLAGVGMFTAAGWSAAMYYMVNSTLVIAGLFLLSELVAAQRGEAADRLQPASAVAQPALLGTMMLLAAASAAGLPPLPGFIGKLLVLEASAVHPWQVAIWSVVLVAGLLTLVGLARAGSLLFWHVRDDISTSGASGASPRLLGATLSLLAMTVAMSIWAAPIQRYTAAAAVQLSDRAAYARAVLGERAETTRPYRFDAPLPKPEATK